MDKWLALSIYLTLATLGLLAGGTLGAALTRTAGDFTGIAWLIGAALGLAGGLLLARRVVQQWRQAA